MLENQDHPGTRQVKPWRPGQPFEKAKKKEIFGPGAHNIPMSRFLAYSTQKM
jgi:hypothetical protein